MKCNQCGAAIPPLNRFCGECGAPRPRFADPFEAVLAQFAALRTQRDAGQIDEQEYEARLERLVLQDGAGVYWMVGAESAEWYRGEGEKWVRADPPLIAPQPAARPARESTPAAEPPRAPAAQPSTQPVAEPSPVPRPSARTARESAPAAVFHDEPESARPAAKRRRATCLIWAIAVPLVLCLIVAGLAAVLPDPFGNWLAWEAVRLGVPATIEPAGQGAPPPTPGLSGAHEAVFSDSFDDASRGWETGDWGTSRSYIQGGELHLVQEQPAEYTWINSPDFHREFSYFVEAHLVGNSNAYYGLYIYDRDDSASTYLFLVSGDGRVRVARASEGGLTDLTPWQASTAINRGTETNQLMVICGQGPTSVTVNGVDHFFIEDPALDTVMVAPLVGATSDAPAHAAFDNVRIYSAE